VSWVGPHAIPATSYPFGPARSIASYARDLLTDVVMRNVRRCVTGSQRPHLTLTGALSCRCLPVPVVERGQRERLILARCWT